MRIEVKDGVLQLFPQVTIGVVHGTISGTRVDVARQIVAMRERSLAALTQQVGPLSAITEHPHIAAWRKAYQAFGVKAKTHKPTHEAFARRLLKDPSWPDINPIVDIYLTNQVAHLLPHGGYDVATLNGGLCLDVSPGDEVFEPLGGGEEFTAAGEVVYRQADRVLTRRWNYRDCDVTKITEETEEFLLMLEAPSSEISQETMQEAVDDLAQRYRTCYEGQFTATLFRPSPEACYVTV